MEENVIVSRGIFDEMVKFLSLYFLLHEEPCDAFSNLMDKIEGI